MLNKKQFLGLMLLLSPMLALSMDHRQQHRHERQQHHHGLRHGAAASTDDLVGEVEGGVDAAADAAARAAAAAAGAGAPSASFMDSMNKFINGYLNAPLNIALTKISALGAKSKLLVGALALYVGWSASGQIAEDVTTNIPNTVKSVFGVDCEDGGCRGGKDDKWTEAA